MSSRISTTLNEQTGSITLAVGDDKGHGAQVDLPPDPALQIAARFLLLLGKTSLTVHPDGTCTTY
jgi:hypothetical protein